MLVDRVDDVALADAVAAADGFVVRHFGDGEAGIDIARREEQLAAEVGEIRAGADPVHVNVLVFDIADEDHADEAVIFEEEFFVSAEGRVFVADGFDAGCGFVDRAGRADIDAHDFEFCGGCGSGEAGFAAAGDARGENAGLVKERSDEAERLAAMFGAFADGEDARV